MGMSAYAKLIIGMHVSRADFYQKTREANRCVKCLRDYTSAIPPRHCQDCGGKVCKTQEEEPKPGFVAYCKKLRRSPDELWETLTQDEHEREIGVFHASPVQTSESRQQHDLIFGYLLSVIRDDDEVHHPRSFDPAEIPDLVTGIHQLATEMDLPHNSIRIYPHLYLSY